MVDGIPLKLAATILFELPAPYGVLANDSTLASYHTSLVFPDCELAFSADGINKLAFLQSHRNAPGTFILEKGFTDKTPDEVREIFLPHFQPGTYDLLRKNCNSFCDCALWFLTGQRIDPEFRRLEKFAKRLVKNGGAPFLERVGITYMANPAADQFKVSWVVQDIEDEEDDEFGHLVAC